jgi:glycopeptide antibiotics resistance protein
MYAAVGLPDITYFRYHPHFNFSPFLYMFPDLETTILNVVLFIPLGFYMPLLWKRFRSFLLTILLGFSITVLIELLQIFTYRATDINDLITNTVGTILGFIAGRIALLLFPNIHPSENTKDIWIVFGSSFGVMFLIYPFFANILL